MRKKSEWKYEWKYICLSCLQSSCLLHLFAGENRMPWYGIALGAIIAILLIVLDETIASKQPIFGVSNLLFNSFIISVSILKCDNIILYSFLRSYVCILALFLMCALWGADADLYNDWRHMSNVMTNCWIYIFLNILGNAHRWARFCIV